MESIKPLLTEIPCELVVVDTVGEATDGSIDVVREYTDKIYRFEWCNDFAKARNCGLEKCSGEWFMFMDDDEWFEDVTEIVEFFKSGEYKKYNCANYKIHTYTDYEGSYSVASLFRLVKRFKDTRFVGKIHEYLIPLQAPAKEFDAFIHHYGYVFDTEEERKIHSERNIKLLEPEFEKDPWNMHVRVQLIQEYVFMKELHDKAELLYVETLNGDKKYYKTNEFQWILLSYVKMANMKSDYEEVVKRAEQVRERFPLSALADIAISMIELSARCKLEQYQKGAAIFEHAIKRRDYLMENPEVKQALLILDFTTFLEENAYSDLLRNGIRCFYNIGDMEKAKKISAERFSTIKTPIITISILASNRKSTIRKCLDSIKPLLDAIPSELIVVDTVGEEHSDGSLTIAKEYTDHIVPFAWCDDFSAARNAGLQKAKGEWFLYLDDDEWFESVEEIIEFFASGEYMNYNSATYIARNYKTKAGTLYNDDMVGRMVHRTKNIEFIGCINETFLNLYSPHKELSAFVHHYGFAYDTEEAKKARMDYTFELLQKDLERYPTNLRNRAQLTAVLSVKEPERAMKICRETLELCKEKKENSQYQWQMVVMFGLLENLQQKTEAVELYNKLKEEDLILPVAEQIVCYRLTRLCIMQNQCVEAYPYAKRYFDLAEEVAQAEVPAEFSKYQVPELREEMLTLGAYCAWHAKAYIVAWNYYEAMKWETMDASGEDSMWKLFAMAEEYTDEDALFRMVKRIMTNPVLKNVLGTMMQTNPQVKQRINAVLVAQRAKQEPVVQEQKTLTEELLEKYRQAEQNLQNAFLSGQPVDYWMELAAVEGRTYFEQIYKPESFRVETIGWLPAEVQYNDILCHFILDGKKDFRGLIEAAKLRPEMAQIIKMWLNELSQSR